MEEYHVRLERVRGRQVLNLPDEIDFPYRTAIFRKMDDGRLIMSPGRQADRKRLRKEVALTSE